MKNNKDKDKDIVTFKSILNIIKLRSTCSRIQVGTLLILDGRIISMGWNGVPPKHKHCNLNSWDFNKESDVEKHRIFSDENELHSECNALMFAAKHGIKTDNSDLYVNISPCTSCAKLIIAAGIKNVYYEIEYDRSTKGIKLLKESGVKIYKI